MNKYVKEFLHRGFVFSGLGPVILGIVYLCISFSTEDFALSGINIFLGIISTYIMAFILAGASVFNQIEHWSLAKSTLFHFITYYLVYIICYLVNSWIPFDLRFLLIFTAVFIGGYFIIWFIICLSIRAISKKLNKKLSL